MAKINEILVNGILTQVTEFDHSAQEIDDVVDIVGTSPEETRLNIGAAGNSNLLDNWYFADPVNQRGQTEYTAVGYTIDRWLLAHDTTAAVTVTEESVALSNSGEGNLFLIQKSERAYDDRSEYTLSVLTAENMLYSAVLKPGSSMYPASGLYFLLSADSVTVGALAGNAWNIKAVKLEFGSVQTLAHQDADGNWVLNDPPPDKGMELAKCQRYFVKFDMVNDASNFIGVATVDGTNHGQGFIVLPVAMRATPALTGLVSLYNVANNILVDTVSVLGISGNLLRFNYGTSDSLDVSQRIIVVYTTNLSISSDL